jgi:hypothetical protein
MSNYFLSYYADKILIQAGMFILTIFLAKKYVHLSIRGTVHTLFADV